MIELERHLEILLLNNDCVIVPNLGGFMTHHIDARYDEADSTFIPPLRTLGFNPQLNINDSLLVQSYIEAYDISYPEALQRVEDEVNELKMHLQENGNYDLNDIGQLTLNADGNYVFSPCEAGILSPTLYGLSSFEINRNEYAKALENKLTNATYHKEEEGKELDTKIIDINTQKLKDESEDDLIKVKFSWIRNSVAIAAVLLAIFILALPTGKTEKMTRTISNINNSILFGMMSEDTNTSTINIKRVDVKKIQSKVETSLKSDTVKVKKAIDEENENRAFCIVLASYVTQRNAQGFVEKLQKKGYDKAKVYTRNNVTRVIYGNYATRQEAYNDLRELHQVKEMAEAWVYKLN